MKNLATVEIEKIVYGGAGMGRIGGKVVFVPFTAPGDRVIAEISREKKNYFEAALRTIAKPSARRVRPFCPVFAVCGGCHLQHLNYADQISLKEANLRDSLHRLRGKGDFDILPTLCASQDRGYRVRAQLKASCAGGRTVLGFYGVRSHSVVAIEHCPLLAPLANEILRGLLSLTDRRKGSARIEGADILVSLDEEKGIVRLKRAGPGDPAFLEELLQEVPCLKGARYQADGGASRGDLRLRFRLSGEVAEEPLEMDIPADCFFQVNPFQNRALVRKVREWARLTGREKVLDLFCGAGNLTLPLARNAGEIWGVDFDPAAISAAAENARKNFLDHCTFLAAPAEAGTARILGETKRVDLVVLDPPRAGAAGALEPIAGLRPQKILYVSCEPPTLARDLSRLGTLGYRVTRLQPLDMFPQTYHLEVIAELVRA
jgi:23S rRNA (uracil1939-C5)-methyltransferase